MTFEINPQKHNDGQFTIPKQVCDLLKLKPLDEIDLLVRDHNGKRLLIGTFKLKSGTEIYGETVREVIKAGTLLRISASKP